MSGAVLTWHASWRDPFDWQERVLRWLERMGVTEPRELLIREIRITAAGDGHVILTCIDLPARLGPDGDVVEVQRLVPLTELPPPRPEVLAS